MLDGREHRVGADAYSDGLSAGEGRFRAECDVLVLAAAMCAPPGPSCPQCRGTSDHRRDGFR